MATEEVGGAAFDRGLLSELVSDSVTEVCPLFVGTSVCLGKTSWTIADEAVLGRSIEPLLGIFSLDSFNSG